MPALETIDEIVRTSDRQTSRTCLVAGHSLSPPRHPVLQPLSSFLLMSFFVSSHQYPRCPSPPRRALQRPLNGINECLVIDGVSGVCSCPCFLALSRLCRSSNAEKTNDGNASFQWTSFSEVKHPSPACAGPNDAVMTVRLTFQGILNRCGNLEPPSRQTASAE